MPELTLDGAERLLWHALDHAAGTEAAVAISVVDRAGHLLCSARMSGAPGVSAQISIDKAKTAAQLGVRTTSLQQTVDAGRPSYLSIGSLCAVSGGCPVQVDGMIVGAIGVSGAEELVDQDIADQAATIFAADLDRAEPAEAASQAA